MEAKLAQVEKEEVGKVVLGRVEVAKVKVVKEVLGRVKAEKVVLAKEGVEKVDLEKVVQTVLSGMHMKIGMIVMNGRMMMAPKEKVELAKVKVERMAVEKVKVVKADLGKEEVVKAYLGKEEVAKADLGKEEVAKGVLINAKEKGTQEKENVKAKEVELLLRGAEKNVNLAALEINVPGVAEDLFVMKNYLLYNHQVRQLINLKIANHFMNINMSVFQVFRADVNLSFNLMFYDFCFISATCDLSGIAECKDFIAGDLCK